MIYVDYGKPIPVKVESYHIAGRNLECDAIVNLFKHFARKGHVSIIP